MTPESARIGLTMSPAGRRVSLPHARSILKCQLPLRVLVLGDSVAAGLSASSYRAAFPWMWANDIREKHGCPVHLINLSRAGLTSADGVEPAEPAAMHYQPDLALVAFGLNDRQPLPRSRRHPFRREDSPRVPAEQFKMNMAKIADRIRRRSGADVVLVSPCRLPGVDEYRDVLVDLAERTEFELADVAGAWPDGGDVLDPEGLHPNDAGHRIYVEVLHRLGL